MFTHKALTENGFNVHPNISHESCQQIFKAVKTRPLNTCTRASKAIVSQDRERTMVILMDALNTAVIKIKQFQGHLTFSKRNISPKHLC